MSRAHASHPASLHALLHSTQQHAINSHHYIRNHSLQSFSHSHVKSLHSQPSIWKHSAAIMRAVHQQTFASNRSYSMATATHSVWSALVIGGWSHAIIRVNWSQPFPQATATCNHSHHTNRSLLTSAAIQGQLSFLLACCNNTRMGG